MANINFEVSAMSNWLSQGRDSCFEFFQLWRQFSVQRSLGHNFIMKAAEKFGTN